MELFDIEKDINEFLNGGSGVAINCATLEDAEKFFRLLRAHDVKWSNGKELDNPGWNTYGEKICYICTSSKRLQYGSIHCIDQGSEFLQYKSNFQNDSNNVKSKSRKIIILGDE